MTSLLRLVLVFFSLPIRRDDEGHVGSLSVSLDDVTDGQPLWTESYDRRDMWQYGETTIVHTTNFSV